AYTFVATWRGQTIRRDIIIAHDQQNVIDWRGEFQALVAQPPTTPQASVRPLKFQVLLPADADLTVDEFTTHSTGETRSFESPDVPVGKTYRYTLIARWRGQTLKREVHIMHDAANVFDWRTELQSLVAARTPTTPKDPDPTPVVKPTPPAVAQHPVTTPRPP